MRQDTAPSLSQRALGIASALRARGAGPCSVALVLGSGLGAVAELLDQASAIDYAEIPGMPRSTAPGHAGRFLLGRVGQRDVLVMQGRFHPYEGWAAADIRAPIYALKRLGVEHLVVTNAAGGLNPDYRPGEIVLLEDHINFTGTDPLAGPNDDTIGVRFPDMSRAYWPPHRELARNAAAALGQPLRSGIYAGVRGPTLETSAERRLLRLAGADLVGMSTVYEVIAAAHCGLKVLAFSVVTNMATGSADQAPDTIEEVLARAAGAAAPMKRLLARVFDRLDGTEPAAAVFPAS